MKNENDWPENPEFFFPYQGKDFCVEVFRSVILRGYKCKIFPMDPPLLLSETPLFEDKESAIKAAIDIINRKRINT